MLNIFADALLIATRIGHRTEGQNHRDLRRSPREFQDVEGLQTGETLRNHFR